MAKTSYTKKDLTKACANVKFSFTNKIKKGISCELSKTAIYSELAKKLNLKSDRTLWRPENQYRDYLDTWYASFMEDIRSLQSPSLNPTISLKDISECPNINKELEIQLQRQNNTIKQLQNIIKTLRLENEALRLAKTERFGYIDTLNLPPETLDATELEKLYQYVSKLYVAMNK